MNDHTVIQSAPGLTGDSGQQPLKVGTLIEGFEIRGIIGLGGFGIVYEAWDLMLERQVALKEYLPGSLAMRLPNGQVQVRELRYQGTFDAGMRSFVNEARLLAQFDHAALVKVYRFWEMSGTAYMVMPLYQGTTLKQHIEQQQEPLAESTLVLWLVALTEALEVMHGQQCYHRDISPENIIIQTQTGLPILLDFGAARQAIEQVSQPFTVILKASYAPIEQYAELPSLTQGPWTDVYALAGVAHYLMTGRTPPSSVGRMVNDNYLPLTSQDSLPFGMALRHSVDSALAVQPHDRTQSMRQFRDGLLTQQPDVLSLFDAPVPARNGLDEIERTVSDRPSLQSSKHRWLWSVGAVLLIVAGLVWVLIDLQAERPVKTSGGPVTTTTLPTEGLPVDLSTGNAQHSTNSGESSQVDLAFQAVLNHADFALDIEPEKVVLKIGEDLLRFNVRSPVSGYVAVYVRSSDNALIQLLPNARVPALGIDAGQLLSLPPANEPIQAAGPAGANQFLVVVTEQARDYVHLHLQDHYGFGLLKEGAQNLQGNSPCDSIRCQDRMAAGWFYVEEVY